MWPIQTSHVTDGKCPLPLYTKAILIDYPGNGWNIGRGRPQDTASTVLREGMAAFTVGAVPFLGLHITRHFPEHILERSRMCSGK